MTPFTLLRTRLFVSLYVTVAVDSKRLAKHVCQQAKSLQARDSIVSEFTVTGISYRRLVNFLQSLVEIGGKIVFRVILQRY